MSHPDFVDAFILCGGQGTRFREISNEIPKALAPIHGVPFLDLMLNDIVSQGCRRIILGTGYLSELIEEHVKKRKDAEYLISKEEKPLGTGGAIRYACPLFQTATTLVMNGDSMIQFSLRKLVDFHKGQRTQVSVLVSSATAGDDYGNIELGEGSKILSFGKKKNTRKNHLTNAGVYCLNRKLIENQNEGHSSLEKEWLPLWSTKGMVSGHVVDRPFHDIGTLERYKGVQ